MKTPCLSYCEAIYACVAGFARASARPEGAAQGRFRTLYFCSPPFTRATRLFACGIAALLDLGIFRLEIASMVKIIQESSLRWPPIQLLLRERAGRHQV